MFPIAERLAVVQAEASPLRVTGPTASTSSREPAITMPSKPEPASDPSPGSDLDPAPDPAPDPAARARALREQLAAYVAALHEACLAAATQAGHDPADLVLADGPFTVAVIAGRGLHLVATRDDLPPRRDHEQVPVGHLPPLEWAVRFIDATVVPGLGARPATVGEEPRPDAGPAPGGRPDAAHDVGPGDVGIEAVLYHLRLDASGALTTHHAMHAGTALAANLVRPSP